MGPVEVDVGSALVVDFPLVSALGCDCWCGLVDVSLLCVGAVAVFFPVCSGVDDPSSLLLFLMYEFAGCAASEFFFVGSSCGS